MTFEELLDLVSTQKRPGLCIDSRDVKEGDIFIAIKGTIHDGHDFIDQAIQNGARYLVSRKAVKKENVEVVLVDNTAKAAAILAQKAADSPASKLTNLAVTGTNGKTTVAFLVRSVLENAGQKTGLITTILYDTGRTSTQATLTTPDCITIAKMQQQMVQTGSKYMVIEASSHALSQGRLAAIDFDAAAFTNLSSEHMDYHKTKEDYLQAKIRLFENLPSNATAVLNKDSKEAKQIADKTNAKIIWFGIDSQADLTAHIESTDINGTAIELKFAGQKQKLTTPLLGKYNVSNLLAAAGLCIAEGLDLQTIAKGLSALKVIPGRLEKVDSDKDFTVLVDYAHTDDALKNVLSTLRPLCRGKLTVVFGCGGDRDKTKRPRMARVAEQLADQIFVTTDNPRTEHPLEIIGQIVTGFDNPVADTIIKEPDRKTAIEQAINSASAGDIVLIAGKGHENYQIIENEKIHFSDKEIAIDCLKNLNEKINS